MGEGEIRQLLQKTDTRDKENRPGTSETRSSGGGGGGVGVGAGG